MAWGPDTLLCCPAVCTTGALRSPCRGRTRRRCLRSGAWQGRRTRSIAGWLRTPTACRDQQKHGVLRVQGSVKGFAAGLSRRTCQPAHRICGYRRSANPTLSAPSYLALAISVTDWLEGWAHAAAVAGVRADSLQGRRSACGGCKFKQTHWIGLLLLAQALHRPGPTSWSEPLSNSPCRCLHRTCLCWVGMCSWRRTRPQWGRQAARHKSAHVRVHHIKGVISTARQQQGRRFPPAPCINCTRLCPDKQVETTHPAEATITHGRGVGAGAAGSAGPADRTLLLQTAWQEGTIGRQSLAAHACIRSASEAPQ